MLKKLLCLQIVSVLLGVYSIDAKKLKIGAIFDKDEELKEKAFRLAIAEHNQESEFELEAVVKNIPPHSPFKALTATCELLKENVTAILGPSTEENSNIIQSVSDDKDIPHLDVRWDDQPMNPIINIYPYQQTLTQAYADIITTWEFENFVILYENNESLRRIGELLKIYDDKRQKNILIRKLDWVTRIRSDGSEERNYRNTLKEVYEGRKNEIILDCSIETMDEILKQAQQVGLVSKQQKYFITNLDLQTINLENYQYGQANITGLRFIDPQTAEIQDLSIKLTGHGVGQGILLDTALIIDAIKIFGLALEHLPTNIEDPQVDCGTFSSWASGTSLTNIMKGIKYNGLTGIIKFDNLGFRSDFGLDVIELTENGVQKVANWTTFGGLNITKAPQPPIMARPVLLSDRNFTVLIALIEPHVMRRESPKPLYGNERYEGFAIDLIDELSNLMHFNYTFVLPEIQKTGNYDPVKKEWDGLLGSIIKGEADFAIADLTITSEREEVVDFTLPYMYLGISILYKKPTKAPPGFFSFADPFALDVWKMLSVAFFIVSIALFILGRISPGEWQNPYPCIEEPEYLVNQLSLRNCFWFMTGSIMQQGTEIAPLAVSTRMAAGMWWFFTLIMVSSYTANLAAFLTTETADIQFSDVNELVEVADRKGIKYGAKANGSTITFFQNSTGNKYYAKIYEYMEKNKDEVLVSTSKAGVIKAQEENYAFFMESVSIQYETERRCDLTKVDGELDEKGYGIAMRKNSSYRSLMSYQILKLQADGVIEDLKRKWWQERKGGGQCPDEEESSEAKPLNLKSVGGVFWVTVIGSIVSLILVFIELILHLTKRSIKTKIPFMTLLKDEMKFFFGSSDMVKPVVYNKTSGENSQSLSNKTRDSNDPDNPNVFDKSTIELTVLNHH